LLDEKLAEQITILDISGQLVIADYFLIATVRNTRHALALHRDLDQAALRQHGRRRLNRGASDSESSGWVLLDFDEVVVQLFTAQARAFYRLEDLWADAPRLPFTPAPRPAAPQEPSLSSLPSLEGIYVYRPDVTTVRVLPPDGDA